MLLSWFAFNEVNIHASMRRRADIKQRTWSETKTILNCYSPDWIWYILAHVAKRHCCSCCGGLNPDARVASQKRRKIQLTWLIYAELDCADLSLKVSSAAFSISKPKGLSSSAKSLVQLGNTFTQSGCGCLKKCLQLSKLLPLPSHKLHTFPRIHKKKKQKKRYSPDIFWPDWPNLNGLHSDRSFIRNNRFFACGTSQTTSKKPMGCYIKDSHKLSLV